MIIKKISFLLFFCFAYHGLCAQTSKNTFIAFIPGFNLPQTMAITSNSALGYVTDTGSNSVIVIDTNPSSPTFNTILSAPSLVGVFNQPVDIAITPNDQFAYVVDEASGSVSVIDTNPNSLTFNTVLSAPNLVGAFANPIGIAIAPNGLYAYVINGTTNTINVIDINPSSPNYNTVLSTPSLNGILNSPFSMVISNDGNYGYVSNLTGSMTVIDTNPASPSFNTPLSAPGLAFVNSQPEGFGFTPDGRYAYVSDGATAEVTWIDTNPQSPTFNTVLSAPNLVSAFNAPNDVAVIKDGSFAYVSNFLGSTGDISSVSVIDVNPLSSTYNNALFTPGLILPGITRFLSLAAAPNGRYVYALDGFNNNIGVIYTGIVSQPLGFSGVSIVDKFLFTSRLVNKLTWTAPVIGNPPTSYRIYRDSSLKNLAATVAANQQLVYYDYCASCNQTYYIISVDSAGTTSNPVSTTVTQLCNT